jgi:hypothetical protein
MAPEFGKRIHQLPLIPANVLNKLAFTNRSIRGSGLPHACSRRSGAQTGIFRSEAICQRGRQAPQTRQPHLGRGGQGRRQFPHAGNRPHSPARDCLSGDRRADRPGTAGDELALLHALDVQFARALGALARTRVEIFDRAAAGFHRKRFATCLLTFPRPRQSEIHGRLHRLRRADPLLRLPWPERLRRLRDQIFRGHARAHLGTETAPRRNLGRGRPLYRSRRRGAPANPLQQFWREHLFAQSMIDNGLYDEDYLVTIAPA